MKCGWCGDVSSPKIRVFYDTVDVRCTDTDSCMRRYREQWAASDWYAEEVKRMAERAPA